MKRTGSLKIYMVEKNGGGRLYLKREWLVMLDIDPDVLGAVDVEITVDSDKKEMLIRKKKLV